MKRRALVLTERRRDEGSVLDLGGSLVLRIPPRRRSRKAGKVVLTVEERP